MRFAFVFILVVAIGGPLVALFWWAIAAKVAPYEDETRRAARKRAVDEGARVIRDFDRSRAAEPRPGAARSSSIGGGSDRG